MQPAINRRRGLITAQYIVFPGIGVDIPNSIPTATAKPGEQKDFGTQPASLQAAVRHAFDAGASGIVISREYDEMRINNLRAIGATLRELGKA